VILSCLLLVASAASAQGIDEGGIDRGALEERGLEGLDQASGFIVDRTITNFGAEFVRIFSQTWREQPGTEEFVITIIERPTARFGSLVWVEQNNRPIVRAFLYAGRSAGIRPVATAAAEYVAKKLADDAIASLLLEDPDLSKEGF
jgi:curli production assembly/transport component CsgE